MFSVISKTRCTEWELIVSAPLRDVLKEGVLDLMFPEIYGLLGPYISPSLPFV
jgi:hypothetical protein